MADSQPARLRQAKGKSVEYEQFIDADRNRIAWVSVFQRFESIMCQLEPLAPKLAQRSREHFYKRAAEPLVKPQVGIAICEEADADLSLVWPLSLDEAEAIAAEYPDKTPAQVMEDHRLACLAEA